MIKAKKESEIYKCIEILKLHELNFAESAKFAKKALKKIGKPEGKKNR